MYYNENLDQLIMKKQLREIFFIYDSVIVKVIKS